MSFVSEEEYTSEVNYDRRWAKLLGIQQQDAG